MKFRTLTVALIAALSIALMVDAADKPKKERPKGKRITIIGTVNAVTDDAGVVKSIAVTMKDGTSIGLAIDEKSQQLLADMAGKEVRIMGMVSEIQVAEYKDAAAEPETKKAPAPKKAKKPKADDDGDAPAPGGDNMGGGEEN